MINKLLICAGYTAAFLSAYGTIRSGGVPILEIVMVYVNSKFLDEIYAEEIKEL